MGIDKTVREGEFGEEVVTDLVVSKIALQTLLDILQVCDGFDIQRQLTTC